MLIFGIIITLIGLFTFMTGGALSNDNPGIEKRHMILFVVGFVLTITGGIVVTATIL